MLVFEPLHGVRVVADPASIDRATWTGHDVTVLRFAPDDAFGIGAAIVDVDDEHAIVEAEAGFVGAWFERGDRILPLEWPLPTERPALAQGSIAGVPAKLWLPNDVDILLVTAAAYADELADRLR